MGTNPVYAISFDAARQAAPEDHERIIRVGCVAAVLCGVLMVVHEVWDDAIPGIQVGATWSALHTSWLASMFVAFLGLTALQRPALDRFGRIAAVVALVGSGAQTIAAAVETIALMGSTAPPSGDPAPPILAAILTVIAAYVAGLLLFSVATIRAGVLPRSAGVLLLVAVLLKMFVGDAIPGTLALVGVAVAWLGVAGMRVARPRESV